MTLIQHHPPAGVVERWQPELDRLATRTDDGLAWLRLVWEPGEAWAPVHRWMIWEMMPAHRAPLGLVDELMGPNPRQFGFYDRVQRRFVRTRSFLINRRQWQMYQDTGLYGRPIWVVQGKVGGHKRFWNEVESNLSLLHGGPAEPPLPGDLPYAEPDQRTIEKLRGLDMVKRFGDVLKLVSNDDALRSRLDFRERAQTAEMARQVWGWLDEQAGEALTFTREQLFEIHCGSDPDAPEPDYDQGKEEFVESLVHNTAF